MSRIEDLNKWLKGKTIDKVETAAVNCLYIDFTDNTRLFLNTESVGHGLYGPVAYEVVK